MKRLFTIFLLSISTISYAQNTHIDLVQLLNKNGFPNLIAADIIINSSSTDKRTGILHIYFKQVVNGSEVFNSQSSINIDKNGNVISKNIDLKNNISVSNNIKLSATTALNIALAEAKIVKNVLNKSELSSNSSFKIFDKNVSSESIIGKPVYFEKNNQLLAAWQIEVLNDETHDWLNLIIDAQDGTIIEKNNYTTHCKVENMAASNINKPYYFEFDDNNSLGKTSPTGSYNVYPIPMESPARGNRQLRSNANDLNASPYGWHDTNAVDGAEFTITRGNNVWAKEDTLGSNGPTGFSPNGGTDLIFDFPYGLDAGPRANLSAAITNLFFWNNTIHDVFNNYGFDEESGNFQHKNYSGLGLGNDYVNADAQDGSGTDNANFATPVDGMNSRMQMYLWGVPTASASNILQVNEPSPIANKHSGILATFSPKLSMVPITANMVLVNDGTSAPTLGCSTLVNSDSIAGKIALITRGTCPYATKIINAQNAGAIAVVIINSSSTGVFAMTGSAAGITVPSLMISKADGDKFKANLDSISLNVSLFDSSVASTKRIYDSDLDNGVIAHEYGHGISTRLTGGAGNSSCLTNQEQAGEGWSDFFALVLTSKPYETTLTGRGMGTHLVGQDTSGLGIRPYRYSRSMITNPVTYESIKTLTVPHGVGFVWCSALYDIYLEMIDKYGFDQNMYTGTGGNNKALQLVVEGLKLQPCNPGFMDARNAIILADSILNGGANKLLLWTAFARRGMGVDAVQGLATSRSDGKNGFKLPTELGNSINDVLKQQAIDIYPNPSNGKFVINASYNLQNVEFKLIDISGKELPVSTKIIKENEVEFNAINLNAGIYFLNIKSENGSITKKIVVE